MNDEISMVCSADLSVCSACGKHVAVCGHVIVPAKVVGPICSFCGKYDHEVKKLIMGPDVGICNECVGLCVDIIGEENQ
jgi:hypothetical protein